MYVARSDRFDGADIVHVILATRGKLDWCRLRAHMKDDLQLLYWYLVLFDFVYPGHRDYLPTELMAECVEAMRTRWLNPPPPGAFKGMRLDPLRFAVDVEDWNYFRDPAMPPAVDQNGDAT
jgi:hypothetical protein